MGLLSAFRAIYSLDTLDARLTTKTSSSPPKLSNLPSLSTPSTSESPESQRTRENAPPSRWRTPEFFIYYLVFAICLPLMFNAVWEVSQGPPTHPRAHGESSLADTE